jgi:AcrR family transcriptional regulator
MTVEAIVEATAQVLRAHGWDDATTRRIAERAGVSEGSIYQYFPSKTALLAAVMERHIDEAAELLGERLSEVFEAPWPQPVAALVGLAVDLHLHDPELHEVLVEEAARVGELERLGAFEANIVAGITGLLEARADEIDCVDPEAAAFLLVHTADAVIHKTLVSDSMDLGRVRLELERMFRRYLG